YPEPGQLCRRRVPDLTAVELTHQALTAALQGRADSFFVDATCGNGHDTLFLCRLAGPGGRVLGLDVQPQAVEATNALLARSGMAEVGQAVCADHRDLLRYAPPGTADCVLFNFGWLPGAGHEVYSTAESTLPALQAALDALKPGGVLAAVLYSGKVIGDGEKQAALAFFRNLPLTRYTVLVCEFANWAATAPLPCLVLKKPAPPRE
ncbi:MAG: class I SAM-dependent methyltransferase, partial [Gemmiger sp.]